MFLLYLVIYLVPLPNWDWRKSSSEISKSYYLKNILFHYGNLCLQIHYYKKQTVYVLPQNTTAELKAEHITKYDIKIHKKKRGNKLHGVADTVMVHTVPWMQHMPSRCCARTHLCLVSSFHEHCATGGCCCLLIKHLYSQYKFHQGSLRQGKHWKIQCVNGPALISHLRRK